MIDLFVKPGDEIKINFVVATDKEGKIYADLVKKDLEELLERSLDKTESYTAIFRKPSYKDNIDMAQSISTNGTDIKINIAVDKYQKMLKLIKSWDIKDGKGNILQPIKENIDRLNPIIAELLANQLAVETSNIFI